MKLAREEIHIWYALPAEIQDPVLLEDYKTLLNDEETLQLSRFRFPKHQHQYLITRVLVRCVLSLYQPQIHPKAWHFKKNAFGKPFIANASTLFFNISHTDEYVVMAVSFEKNIGIDIEKISSTINYMEIAERNFSAKEAALLKNTPKDLQPKIFFSLWTLKEAYLKASGNGLSVPLHTVCFAKKIQQNEEYRINYLEDWQFWQACQNENHILCLGINSSKTFVIDHHFFFPI